MKWFSQKCKQNESIHCCSYCTEAVNSAELYDHVTQYHRILPQDMDGKTFWFAANGKLLGFRDRLDEMDRKDREDRELAMKLSKSIRWH